MKKIILIMAIFLGSMFWHPTKTWAISKNEVLTAVNLTRLNYSQKSLRENLQLNRAAEAKLADIQKYLYWSHNNPTTNKTWLSFIRESGFNGNTGENLAKGFGETDRIITAWLNSPSHRKNLLSGNFNAVGMAVGEVNYGDGLETVVVMEFGKQNTLSFIWK
jgi:uncharacterized protein YkwD